MRKLKWLTYNAIIPASIIIGEVYKISGLVNIGLFVAIIAFIGSLVALNEKALESMANKGFAVKKETDFGLDFVILMILVYFGHTIVGTLWMIHSGILYVARHKLEEKEGKKPKKA